MAAMTQFEIKTRIDEIYAAMENSFDPCTFVLNKQAKLYEDEIDQLRGQCVHEFENGVCKYCYCIEK